MTSTDRTYTTDPDVTIGEVIRYRVTLNLSPGVMTAARMEDRLSRGLVFVRCTGISAPGLTTSIAGGFAQICSNPDVQTYPTGSSNPADQGRRVIFDFGTLTNSSSGTLTLIIDYEVVVLNNSENNRGDNVWNSAYWYWSGGFLSDSAPPMTIVEPTLNISKSANPTILTPGGLVRYTIVISHALASDVDAFDLVMTDAIPTGLTYEAGTLDCTLGVQDPDVCFYNGLTETIQVEWTMASGFTRTGGNAIIEFEARIDDPPPSSSITNTAFLEWSTLPGDFTAPFATSGYNPLATERFYDPPDPVNVYGARARAIIRTPQLPATGFAPDRITRIQELVHEPYFDLSSFLTLEIPKLGENIDIVGIPLENESWNLDWLWDRAGYLAGTAFPTFPGNTAITAHVYLPDGSPGPFVDLKLLRWGDTLILHAFGLDFFYEVREVRFVAPDDTSAFRHEELDWLTLITCQGYDEQTDAYRWRVVVRAVLMTIE